MRLSKEQLQRLQSLLMEVDEIYNNISGIAEEGWFLAGCLREVLGLWEEQIEGARNIGTIDIIGIEEEQQGELTFA